jgi:hypothetical protein
MGKMALAQRFEMTDNLDGAEQLWNNIPNIASSTMSSEEIMSKYGINNYKSEATKSTTMMEQQQAQITNEFVKSAVDGMKMAGEALVNTVQQAFAGATFTVKNGEVNFSRNPIKVNKTKTAGKQDTPWYGNDWVPFNGN